jgi:hypothetical protein
MDYDVIHPELTRYFGGPVAAAIIDDQPFHLVKAVYMARQGRQHNGKAVFLIQARDLDDQLHGQFLLFDRCLSSLKYISVLPFFKLICFMDFLDNLQRLLLGIHEIFTRSPYPPPSKLTASQTERAWED